MWRHFFNRPLPSFHLLLLSVLVTPAPAMPCLLDLTFSFLFLNFHFVLQGRVHVIKLPYSDLKSLPADLPAHLLSSALTLPKQMNSLLTQLLQVFFREGDVNLYIALTFSYTCIIICNICVCSCINVRFCLTKSVLTICFYSLFYNY